MKLVVERLHPGDDLRAKITELVVKQKITAGVVLSGVGNLTKLTVRRAGATPDHQPQLIKDGDFEIVSLHGTVGMNDQHLHISAADREGNVIGGHLRGGCIVGVTAEIVILVDPDLNFHRRPDPQTGFDELSVE
jgi:predicted DNA-binding protein with PD1-like motif